MTVRLSDQEINGLIDEHKPLPDSYQDLLKLKPR